MPTGPERILVLREPGICRACGRDLPAGTTARYRHVDGTFACVGCYDEPEVDDRFTARGAEHVAAGAGVDRRVRRTQPRLGDVLLALSAPTGREDPAAPGGVEPERRLAATLEELCAGAPARFLHQLGVAG